jgi:hypothetical protein
MLRKQPRRSLMKGLYVGSIFIATTISLGSRISKGRGYSRSDTQETARKTQERLSMKQFIFSWSRRAEKSLSEKHIYHPLTPGRHSHLDKIFAD